MLAGMLKSSPLCAFVLGLSLLIVGSSAAGDVVLLDHQASVEVSLYAIDEVGDGVSDVFSQALETPGDLFAVVSPGGFEDPMAVFSAGMQGAAGGLGLQQSQLEPTATGYVYTSYSFVAAGAYAKECGASTATAASETTLVFACDTPFIISVVGQIDGTEAAYVGVLDANGAEPSWLVYTDTPGPGEFSMELSAGVYGVAAGALAQANVNTLGVADDASGSVSYWFSATVTPIPEPAVVSLLLAGGLWLRRRR